MKEKTYIDPQVGPVLLRKNRRSRRITLRVSPRSGVTVTMPFLIPFRVGLEFFLSKKDWVLKMQEKQRDRFREEPQPGPDDIEAMRSEAKRILTPRLAELAERYSFKYNQVRIKHNVSNWGSCSRKGNINLNLNLVRLPEELRDYVLLHELCHLRHPDHGPDFHSLLESVCPDHRKKEKELRKFRIF
ncbi:MAG: M48 family metallopeptidase [Bacteroidales bacterium]|nr:M48 family metallopeptidase [Bacteroidales bacterium]